MSIGADIRGTIGSWLVFSFELFGRPRRRKIIFSGDYLPPGFFFQFQAGFLGDGSAGLRGGFVFLHAGGLDALGDLAGGEFREGGEDQFRLAHVVAEVLGL